MGKVSGLRRTACLALSCALILLSACAGGGADKAIPIQDGSSGSESETKMGRYLEEQLVLPEDVKAVKGLGLDAQDRLVLFASASAEYGEGPYMLYASQDAGSTWDKKEAKWLEQFAATDVNSIAYGPDGALYLLTQTITPEDEARINQKLEKDERLTGEDFPPYVLWSVPEGAQEPVEIPLQFNKSGGGFVDFSNYPGTALELTDSGDIALNGGFQIDLYDGKTGELKVQFEANSQIGSFAAYGDRLSISSYGQDGKVQVYSNADGSEQDAIPKSPAELNVLYGDSVGLYACGVGGLQKLGESGSWESILEGGATSLSMPTMRATGMLRLPQDSYMVLCQSSSGSVSEWVLLRYTFSADTPASPSKELAIYSLADSATVRQAIGLYQREHPEVAVRFAPVLSEASSMTRSDAIRVLNTELLAGKGPDVLVLDGLPVESYIQKGVLADLADTVQTQSLLPFTVNTYQREGGLYAVPGRFGVPVLWAPSDCLESGGTLSGLAEWIKANAGKKADVTPLISMKPNDLIRMFAPASAPAWIDENKVVQEEKLSEFLSAMKTMADSGRNSDDEMPQEYLDHAMQYLSVSWAMGRMDLLTGIMQGFDDVTAPEAGIGQLKNGDGGYRLMTGQSSGVFVPETILGINRNAALPDEAKALLQVILSDAVQQKSLDDGLPVLSSAFEAGWACPYPEGKGGSVYSSTNRETGESLELSLRWPPDAFMQEMKTRFSALETPSVLDPVLVDMVVEGSQEYFSGSKAVEDAVREIAQRVDAYMKE